MVHSSTGRLLQQYLLLDRALHFSFPAGHAEPGQIACMAQHVLKEMILINDLGEDCYCTLLALQTLPWQPITACSPAIVCKQTSQAVHQHKQPSF